MYKALHNAGLFLFGLSPQQPSYPSADETLWIFQPLGDMGYGRYVTQHGNEVLILDIHSQPSTADAAAEAARFMADTMQLNPKKGLWDQDK